MPGGNIDCSTGDEAYSPHVGVRTRRRAMNSSVVVAGLLVLHTIGAPVSSQESSFGRCSILPLDYTPQFVAQVSPSGIVVLSDDSPSVHLYTIQNGQLTLAHAYSLARPVHAAFACTFSVPGDGIAVPSRDGQSVVILRLARNGLQERAVPANVAESRINIADINNDHIPDIVIFGKSTSGVSVLYGKKNGSFSAEDHLFTDISATDLVTADLNRDGITDVLLLDWLANKLIIFYGIGQSVFSEQVSITLPGEPSRIALTPPNRQRTIAAAITIPDAKNVVIVNRDATGEFFVSDTITADGEPGDIVMEDINGDHSFDVIYSTPSGIHVSMANPAGGFSAPVTFGIASTSSFSPGDLDGDGTVDLVVTDRSSKRLVALANDRSLKTDRWPSNYAVGTAPRGVAALDVDGDGKTDLVVANSNSSSLSVLLNKGEGVMAGQQSVPINEHPSFIRAPLNPVATVVTSHTRSDQLTVVRLAGARPVSYSVPTGAQPFVVFANQDPVSGNLNMIVRYSGTKKTSLSLFEQIQQQQFIERNLTPSRPIGAVNVQQEEGTYRLVYSSFDSTRRQSSVFTASSRSGFTFGEVRQLFSYEDSTNATRLLFPAFVDRDSLTDIVTVLDEPRNAMGIAFGDSGDVYRGDLFWVRGIRPINADAVIIKDVDDDGFNDITAIDALRKAVVTVYGRRNREFDEPRVIYTAGDIGGIQIAALRGKTSHDLIVTHFRRGTVEIVFDPFRR